MKIQELGKEYLLEAEQIGAHLRRLREEYLQCKNYCQQVEIEHRMEMIDTIYQEMCSTGNYLMKYPATMARELT